MNRIFINDYGYDHKWIMGIIADDILREANKLGYQCRCGSFDDYEGEEIYYHLNYAVAVPEPKAKHNSVFYTHLNDALKEKDILSIKEKFDSFICMSPEDAQFLIELGFEPSKVYGRVLPVRNTFIKPISIGIFSACYPDGRKNEQWLIDYCSSNRQSKLVNFVFIGKGWGRVAEELEKLGCTYDWHNVSRNLPYEYQYQQNKLSSLNYYIYMGMDGGAMGTYDAYAQDVPLCVTYDGFHKAIPDLDYKFDNKQTFYSQMDEIISKHARRLDFFDKNRADNYVKWIVGVWNGEISPEIAESEKSCISYHTVVEKKRDQYYPLSISKLRYYLSLKLVKFKTEKKLKK